MKNYKFNPIHLLTAIGMVYLAILIYFFITIVTRPLPERYIVTRSEIKDVLFVVIPNQDEYDFCYQLNNEYIHCTDDRYFKGNTLTIWSDGKVDYEINYANH